MHKFLLALCLIFTAANGQIRDLANYSIESQRSQDYIKANHEQYARDIAEIDKSLANLKQSFEERAESVELYSPMTIARIEQTLERLNPLQLMSDFSSKCINKYIFLVPTVAATKASLANCLLVANNQVPNIMKDPQNYRNAIVNYVNTYYEAETKKCASTFPALGANYTNCITTVTKNTNANIINYQKGFDNLLDLAKCTIKAVTKALVNCFTAIQTNVESQLVEASVSINNCLTGKEKECEPCPAVCSDVREMHANYTSETIRNPYFGAKDNKGCLLWNVK